MKALIVLSALITLGLVTGCSSNPSNALGPNPKTLTADQVEHRDGLFYEIGADEPYTGLIKESFSDGRPLLQQTFIYGLLTEGIIWSWHPNGQKESEATVDSSGSMHLTKWYKNGQRRLDQHMKLDP